MNEYRYSDRGVIRVGDVFRASGGETYNGARCGSPGRYKLLAIVEGRKGRIYLECQRCDRHGVPTGGYRLLYVQGKPYRMKGLTNLVVRPYKVSRQRSQTTIKETMKLKRKAKKRNG
jgi:hypothetical protein